MERNPPADALFEASAGGFDNLDEKRGRTSHEFAVGGAPLWKNRFQRPLSQNTVDSRNLGLDNVIAPKTLSGYSPVTSRRKSCVRHGRAELGILANQTD